MKVSNRNRYIRSGSSGSGSGGAGDAITTYSEIIVFTQFFDIIQVIDDKTIQINTHDVSLFPIGQIALIDGSTDETNDGLYEVASRIVLGINIMNVGFTEANLTIGLTEDGSIHIAKNVDVQHDLDTEDIIFRLKNESTGTTTTVEDDSTDNNILTLKPAVPILGDFRISVFAKK